MMSGAPACTLNVHWPRFAMPSQVRRMGMVRSVQLTILSVAHPFAPVGTDAVGGAEQVLSMIDEGLVHAGHRSIVVACEGSKCRGELFVSHREPAQLDELARRAAQRAHAASVQRVLRDHKVDVVHLHGLDFDRYLPVQPGVPLLATLHQPPDWYRPEVFRLEREDLFLQCVSESQRRRCPASKRLLEANPNGVPLDQLSPTFDKKSTFALMLGRICPEKGFDQGLVAAQRADVPLVLAGRVFAYPEHQRYFEKELAPLFDDLRTFIGPIGMQRKRLLLAAARCVLIPSLAPEMSSLVAMEALASGTPVIAFRTGALAELIDHGSTGFLVEDIDEMADALQRVHELSPARCRLAAEERFSARDMVQRYIATYERIRAPVRPRIVPSMRPALLGEPPLRVHEITRLDVLESLKPAWSELYERCPTATPCQSPEWLLAWCRHFGVRDLKSLALFRGAELVGLAPFLIYEQRGARVLTQLGSGVSDYQDVLLRPDELICTVRAVQHWLHARRGAWDVCDLEQLSVESPLMRVELDSRGSTSTCLHHACPVLRLRSSPTAFADAVPSPLRKNLRYARRMLERLGPLHFETADTSNVDAMFRSLLALHGACGQTDLRSGGPADAKLVEFHRELAPALARRGMLRLHLLRSNERVIAAFYGFLDKRRLYYCLSGFDPEFARMSPGAVVLERAIQAAIGTGAGAIEFLRGQALHKHAWGAEDSFTLRRTWVQSASAQPQRPWRRNTQELGDHLGT
jgi:CelD/BcsL family acetyltransferase involved in cellulose biosynthesis/glycosyltransferase involved in cell wall biosynthesis